MCALCSYKNQISFSAVFETVRLPYICICNEKQLGRVLQPRHFPPNSGAYTTVSRSPPCVFSIPPHLAFRHATMTQWCCVTGQAGHWLFVSIQINHSLFWTDNVINAHKGHRVYSSQAWCVEQGRSVYSKWNTLDWLSLIWNIDTVVSGIRLTGWF